MSALIIEAKATNSCAVRRNNYSNLTNQIRDFRRAVV